MPMMMSDEEIRTSYRDARFKKTQIKILAELNDCPESSILAILHAGESDIDPEAAYGIQLYKNGMTSREAAEKSGANLYRLRYLLNKYNIRRK